MCTLSFTVELIEGSIVELIEGFIVVEAGYTLLAEGGSRCEDGK